MKRTHSQRTQEPLADNINAAPIQERTQEEVVTEITCVGAGCASLSLAKEVAKQNITSKILTDKRATDRPEHMWGFWQMPWLDDAASQSHHHWQKWQIITSNLTILHESHDHPYHALSSKKWLGYCASFSHAEEIISPVTSPPQTPYFDSRPLAPPQGAFYQHFLGYYIKTRKPVFDPSIATLMDFRCDQSHGLHFIYLLPTSPTEALVESTLFSADLLQDDHYIRNINIYLNEVLQITDFEVTDTEKGVIPLADCRDRTAPQHAIGARGGALRPSSGYAFSFIQKQVSAIAEQAQKTGQWRASSPLSFFDLWMDKVFLSVLKQRPDLSVSIFESIGKALTGSEFAQFMSGTAPLSVILKMMLSMPKWPFIIAALSPRTYSRSS